MRFTLVVVALALSSRLSAGAVPLLSDSQVTSLANELSGESAKRNLEGFSRLHRMRGSRDFRRAADQVIGELKKYGYADAHIEQFPADGKISGNRSAWSIVNSVMTENIGNRDSCMVGASNPSVIESVQSINGKFHASNGERSLWVSDTHCPELRIDLDETVWKPDGSGLDKSDLMGGHLFDELRYLVQSRYPVNAKHRGGTFTKATAEDQFDVMLPAFGRG